MNSVMVDAQYSLFTSAFDPPPGASSLLESVDPRPAQQAGPSISEPYVLAALIGDRAVFPADVTELDDAGLRAVVDELVAGWHPDLRRALAESRLPRCAPVRRFATGPGLGAEQRHGARRRDSVEFRTSVGLGGLVGSRSGSGVMRLGRARR